MLDGIPGTPPPAPPWGQQVVPRSPDLARRIQPAAGATGQICVVLGAGGALAPDLVHALLLRGHPVVGVDVQLTYRVEGATYRRLDLRDAAAVAAFFADVRAIGTLGPVFNLAAIQTSPTAGRWEDPIAESGLLDALCDTERDATLFHMSTAEVYGAPPGAPYAEGHTKAPFNPYGRAKWAEEQALIAAHGRPTRGGVLRVTALRTWTIVMVNAGPAGEPLEARNYNDPLIAVAAKLARAGVRVPIADRGLLAQFHPAEEVVEVSLLLAAQPPDAQTWGRAWNCPGRACTHGEMVDDCFDIFSAGEGPRPWWAPLAFLLTLGGHIPGGLLTSAARGLEMAGGALGARQMAGRLPFLYRSTHMDSSALSAILTDQLTEPEGSDTRAAVRRLAAALKSGGEDALSARRYAGY